MKDMTKGFPAKVIIMFAIPLMLGNILQQLYNVTDSKIVSESIESGLAAIGATAVVSNLLINFICGLTQGFGIMIARSFGEKDYVSLRRYVAGTVKLTSVVTVIFTVVFLIVIRPVLVLLNTPADILDDAVSYVRIIIAGLVFVALYNMSANILRSMGDSKRPLICLIIGIVVNVGLDILFVIVLKTGITGAAYATVISQFIAGICCFLLIIIKYRHIIPKKDEWKPNRQQYGSMIAAGSSMALMGCIVSIGTVILQSGINGLGTDYVTAHIAGRRVFDIMMVMIFTIGLSMTTYVSQNLGAGEYGRIRKGIWHAIVIDTIIASALVVFAYTLGGRVVKWVASTDNEEVVSAGIRYIRVGVLFFYVLGPLFILRCSLQGLGQKIVPLVSSCLELTVKILSTAFLVPWLGYFGVILTEPVSWVVMIVPLIVVYIIKRPGKNMESHDKKTLDNSSEIC